MEQLNVIIDQKNGLIDFSNFEELKETLSGYLDEYRGASFTEESKGLAKDVMADLRKLKKAVNDRKIEVKKGYMQPYDEFEAKVKELLALIDEPIALIDSQVQKFEQKRVQERKEQIRDIYDEMIGDLADYAPLSRIYSTKWENASTSAKKIREDIEQALLGIQMDVESLKLMRVEADIVEYALDKYKSGGTAVESMRKANEFAELTEARKRAQEAIADQEVAKATVEPEPTLFAAETSNFDLAFETPSTKTAIFRVVASVEKLEALEGYLAGFGYSYERVE